MTVLDALAASVGSAHAEMDIARATGRSTRDVEHEIERLRKSGKAAICSDSQVGYWLPESAEEYAVNLDRRRRRALGQLVTVRGERLALRAMQQPLTLFPEVAA